MESRSRNSSIYLPNIIVAGFLGVMGLMFYPGWPALMMIPFIVVLLVAAHLDKTRPRKSSKRYKHSIPEDSDDLKKKLLERYIRDVMRPPH